MLVVACWDDVPLPVVETADDVWIVEEMFEAEDVMYAAKEEDALADKDVEAVDVGEVM